jgi:WD40 repeat protein
MPRAAQRSPRIEGEDELCRWRGRSGVAKFGLISLRSLGLIMAALVGVAWLPERDPHAGGAHGQLLTGEPGGGGRSIALSPDGEKIATTDFKGHLTLWHTDGGWWSEKLIELGGYAYTSAFSPDGRFLAGGGESVALCELGPGGAVKALRLPFAGVRAMAFSPDSKTLAATFLRSSEIVLWDLTEGRQRAILKTGVPSIMIIDFSPDGRYLAAGSNGLIGSFTVWKLATGECTLRVNGDFGPVRGLAFSRDGTSIATSGVYERYVRLWDAKTGRLLRSLAGHKMGTTGVAFSPDGTILATVGNDGMGRLWKIATGELLDTLDGEAMSLQSVAFSPDGFTLAAVAIGDNDVRIWDMNAG